ERISVASALFSRSSGALVLGASLAVLVPLPCQAQTPLDLRQAIETALRSRPDLKASSEAISAAQGRQRQAGLWSNPDFQFSNENLRPGQHYWQDVDIHARVTQRLD